MGRGRRSSRDIEPNYWIGYTDLLAKPLLILLLVVALSTLARTLNDTPPMVPLTEAESFRFPTGSYALSADFKLALTRKLPETTNKIDRYRIDTLEVVGHTDGQPSPGSSNLDLRFLSAGNLPALKGFAPGSNTDLGLLRAIAVANYLREALDPNGDKLIIRVYSAGSLIDVDGNYAPADSLSRADRRRIEVRLTRQERG